MLNSLLVGLLFCYFVEAARYGCNKPLLDKAVLKATSSRERRGPENARLTESNAWSAGKSDNTQALIIDLGSTKMVTAIATQGRPFTREYIIEYTVSYGSNGLDYAFYKEPSGNSKMFQGNTDGDTIKQNSFDVPIIAQWIQIHPTRWNDRISLRAELYGCDYEALDMSFNGSSLVRWDLKSEPISSTREAIRFRFKTTQPDGLLLYSKGTQGDYIALQIYQNRMILNMNLGSGHMSSFSVGSLLDDNMWHEVVISRNRNDLLFSVDRVSIKGDISGEFSRLDLNREIYIGGSPTIRDGIVVNKNFTGCIENIIFNSTNLIEQIIQAYEERDEWRMSVYHKHHILHSCPDPPIIPVTFLTTQSYAKLKGYEGVNSLNISFTFRTYETDGVLLYHTFTSPGYIKLFLYEGRLHLELSMKGEKIVVLDNFGDAVNDGKWHDCIVTMQPLQMAVTIDKIPVIIPKELSFSTGPFYYLGGGSPDTIGFKGCMRMVSIDGNYKLPTDWKEDEYCCKGEILLDSCQMIDRCNPNPCEHGGICSQTSLEFSCECEGTGYTGAVCHTAIHPLSCAAYRDAYNMNSGKVDTIIDIDGSGPLAPFKVTCEFQLDKTITVVHHHNEEKTSVDGHQEPGGFRQEIQYNANYQQLDVLARRSTKCTQYLSYRCKQSRLFNSPTHEEQNFKPFGWWVSRHNQKMDYWAGAVPGSRKCYCGMMGNCVDNTKWCNCDAGLESFTEDGGELSDKDTLPVRQLRFGDTGDFLDNKEAQYQLGPLRCEGDSLFDNAVTFRLADASIDLPPFDFGHSGDIYLEFKTTTKDTVVLLHSKGPSDYIKLSYMNGYTVQFKYKAGGAENTLRVDLPYFLNDEKWHSVIIERNRKEARLTVDGRLKAEGREPDGPVRSLLLNSKLVIGSTTDYTDGYSGCIRSLFVNGEPVDLRSYAERGMYGISPGCVRKCDSSPCLNNGTCHEKYNGYWCDCRWSSFKGPICADEIGVNLRSDAFVRYDFEGSFRSTTSEKIRVGFTTTDPKGFLLGLFSNITKEYLTIMVSNSGHLRVVFDFGFERQEVVFPNKLFSLGQYHDVKLQRKDLGSTLVLTVDNYEPAEFHFNVKESADTYFSNIQTLYIGKNESMTEGFVGCISRVEFDDIYPLKLLFQEDGPPNVKMHGKQLSEDFCGVEPITHPPDPVETRPPPDLDVEKLLDETRETDLAVVGGIVAFILFILLLAAFLVGRYISRHKGEYLTQEDAGADMAPDPDTAVVSSTTGPHVQKKREWFI